MFEGPKFEAKSREWGRVLGKGVCWGSASSFLYPLPLVVGLRSTVNSQVGFGGSSDRICILDGLRALKTRKVATKRSLVTVSHLISYSNRDL